MKLQNLGIIISILTGIVGAYVSLSGINKPSSYITANIVDSIFYIPPQYNERMYDLIKKSEFDEIYNIINPVAIDSDFNAKEKVVNKIGSMMRQPFTPPFDKGLQEYQRLIFISVTNVGDAQAKNIYVDYPEKVIIMFEDDKSEMSNKKEPLTRFQISSIKQNGSYRIWAWAKNNDFDKYKINIGDESQVADIRFGEEYYGKTAKIASFIDNNIFVISLVFAALIAVFIYCLISLIASFIKTD